MGSAANLSFMTVRIKQSKTDPFRRGVQINIGRTGGPLCPLAAVLAYMATRKRDEGPFFKFSNGLALTRARFGASMREVLQEVGIDHSRHSGHSFQIRAATTAAA